MKMINDSSKQLSLFKEDGWKNTLKGLQGSSDVTRHTTFGTFNVLDDQVLTNMWMGDGFAKKIVSAPVDDMTRNWIEIENDTTGNIEKEMMRLDVKTEINTAMKWARLYRGCVIALGINDGGDLTEPIKIDKVKSIDWIKVFPVPRVINSSAQIEKDSESEYFGDFEIFQLQKIYGGVLEIHRSRCLVFKGEPAPTTTSQVGFEYLYWGISALQSTWTQISNYGALEQGLINLMLEAVIGIYKIDNLANLLAENNTEAVYTRMEIINYSKSLINSVLLGANEEFTRNTASFAGIPEMTDRFMMNLSAVTEIPVTRLFGRSPAGENATGTSDLMTYYDMVKAKQETQLFPPLQYLVSIINQYAGNKQEDPLITFNPIWQPTPMELMEMKKQQAEIDQIYINMGVLDDNEVRTNRFEGGESFTTDVEGEAPGKEEIE
jgi:phage-related protein (TIGR01555 family)